MSFAMRKHLKNALHLFRGFTSYYAYVGIVIFPLTFLFLPFRFQTSLVYICFDSTLALWFISIITLALFIAVVPENVAEIVFPNPLYSEINKPLKQVLRNRFPMGIEKLIFDFAKAEKYRFDPSFIGRRLLVRYGSGGTGFLMPYERSINHVRLDDEVEHILKFRPDDEIEHIEVCFQINSLLFLISYRNLEEEKMIVLAAYEDLATRTLKQITSAFMPEDAKFHIQIHFLVEEEKGRIQVRSVGAETRIVKPFQMEEESFEMEMDIHRRAHKDGTLVWMNAYTTDQYGKGVQLDPMNHLIY